MGAVYGTHQEANSVELQSDLQTLREQLSHRDTNLPLPSSHLGGSLQTQIGPWQICMDGVFSRDEFEQWAPKWRNEGIDALKKAQGPFAMIAYNTQTKTLWLSRSADGIRPLYWCKSKAKIAVSSEIPPLLNLPWFSAELATEHIAEQLSFRYVHAPRTLLRELFAVPAGSTIAIDADGERQFNWFQPQWRSIEDPPPDEEECLIGIDQLLKQSVEKRLRGAARPGVLLSGGIDSSAILHHSCSLRRPPLTFTVTVEGLGDESPFAARVAKVMGAENEVIRFSSTDLIQGFEQATKTMGQPLSGPSGVVQELFYRSISGRCDRILSGDGGDEILAGRSMPELAQRLSHVKAISKLPAMGSRIVRSLARRLGNRDLAAEFQTFGMSRSIGASRIFLSPDRVDILSDPGLVRPGIRRTVLTPFYQEVDSDPINEILHVWQRGWLTEDSLLRSDRTSMKYGVDVRYPMLDRKLIDYCSRLPGHYKVKRKGLTYVSKSPLRDKMETRLPKGLLHRPKRTLIRPLDYWLRHEGRRFLKTQVEGLCQNLPHIFVPSMVRRLEKEHLQGSQNHGLRLWTLILFHMWHEELGL